MDKAEVIQVIRTTLLRRGNGEGDPIRIIEQFWSLDGELLVEKDPLAGWQGHVTDSEGHRQ